MCIQPYNCFSDKIKYTLKFYWLEPGSRIVLEIEQSTFSPDELYVSGQREQEISESKNPYECVRTREERKHRVYKQVEDHYQYTAQGTH